MSEKGHIADRTDGIPSPPRFRVRRSDFTSGISLAALIGLLAILASSFHSYSDLVSKNLESFELRMSKELDKLDARLRDLEERRWR